MKIKLSIFLLMMGSVPLLFINTPIFGFGQNFWSKIVIGSVILFYMISYLFIHRIYSSYKRIRHGIETMKDEDYTIFLNNESSNEFDTLVQVYNDMLEKLRTKRIENKQLQLFFENVIQKLPFAIIILKEFQFLNFANAKAEKLLKFNSNKITNNQFSLVNHYLVPIIINEESENGQIIKQYGERIKMIRSSFVRDGHRYQIFVLEELTSSILQTQLDSWKKMIRVMSHEINNSISPIISITQSLGQYLERFDDIDQEMREGMIATSSRLKNLSNFINDYSKIAKLPNLKRQNLSVNNFMNRIIKLMVNQKDKRVQINYLNQSQCEFFFIDENLFEQAIINIIKNGIEASDAKNNIKIDITIKKVRSRHHIIIQDFGSGIPEEVFDNLFVPYFTTKQSGNGIGLSFVQEILSNHDFKYFIESEQNKGTSFYIEIH